MKVRKKEPGDQFWIEKILSERWGRPEILVHGERIDAQNIPALIAGQQLGLLTYQIRSAGEVGIAEIITLDAITPKQGIGTALLDALVTMVRAEGLGMLRVTTTNDNLDALRFYQRRGFRIKALRCGAADEARRIKPSIPLVGEFGIPIHDEIELERPI
jgi:GNAT superfamily N-acetyltransferase